MNALSLVISALITLKDTKAKKTQYRVERLSGLLWQIRIYFQLRNLSLSENITLRIKRADTDFSFTASDNINCFIVNDDEYHPEGTDIKTDLDNDTLDTSYIPNKNKDEFDNSFVAGTENVNDQEDEGLIHLS